MNKTILLEKRPVGKPALSDFKLITEEIPVPVSGEVLLKSMFVSVDPYLRGRMKDVKSYIPPFELHQPIISAVIAEVTDSKNDKFRKGDHVSGMLPWKVWQISNGKGLRKIDEQGIPLSAYLGVLGMTGLTAYFGLLEIGKPQKGETLLVSGAAGAVGGIVGQIGKIMGLRVVGIAGSDEKVALLKSSFGFDAGINYNATGNMSKAIAGSCPDGVDIYFDNVGGPISDAVLLNINTYARIVVCGAISVYNETSMPKSMAYQPFLIRNRALMQGFIVSDFADRFPQATLTLAQWLQEGKLKNTETIREGFENIPQAFIDLFDGKNKGKMSVRV